MLNTSKEQLIWELKKRVEDKILEPTNFELLKKLIEKADTINEAIAIYELGTTYKRTGFHFDKRLDKIMLTDTIRYFKKNEQLSFVTDKNGPTHKLIIGDNYPALLNLMIQYRGAVDVIYIDPPYGKDDMGEFALTNYQNAITRDNLLSMLYPRLLISKMLLSQDGVIFCSIDDRNQAYVKGIFDEVFGESHFIFCAPRLTKKSGKTTETIQKNHDYILCYSISNDIIFSQLDKDLSSYDLEDEFVNERGRYKLTQPLDYNSLTYSPSMDYPLEFEGKIFYPGGDKKAWEERQKGNYQHYDWAWRWSKSAVEWGIKNKMLALKGNRIYTKTYAKCRKKVGVNELEFIDTTKPYTTLSFLENEFSNDNGKKELDRIFGKDKKLFNNPKPTALIKELIKMACPKKDAIILDYFAGTGTTGQAVLELNASDDGSRQFILCQMNEVTPENPGGIAYDVTVKRLKRVMTGSCYDGTTDFEWIRSNEPLGGNLDVYEIAEIANFSATDGQTPL